MKFDMMEKDLKKKSTHHINSIHKHTFKCSWFKCSYFCLWNKTIRYLINLFPLSKVNCLSMSVQRTAYQESSMGPILPKGFTAGWRAVWPRRASMELRLPAPPHVNDWPLLPSPLHFSSMLAKIHCRICLLLTIYVNKVGSTVTFLFKNVGPGK